MKVRLVRSGVELLGWRFVILCCGEFGVSQVITTFVLLLHAVGEEEEEQDGTDESNHPASDHRWRGHKQRLASVCCPAAAAETKQLDGIKAHCVNTTRPGDE